MDLISKQINLVRPRSGLLSRYYEPFNIFGHVETLIIRRVCDIFFSFFAVGGGRRRDLILLLSAA